jgi:hypothetical protein
MLWLCGCLFLVKHLQCMRRGHYELVREDNAPRLAAAEQFASTAMVFLSATSARSSLATMEEPLLRLHASMTPG